MRSIRTKYLVAAGLVLAGFSILLMARTWSNAQRQLERLVAGQAGLALEFDLAIRQYVADHVRPEVQRHVSDDTFLVETMSTSFVARSIFDRVKQRFPDYVLKFSALNPRNPANLAGPTEREIIDYFKRNPEQTHWSGEVQMDGEPYMAYFSARRFHRGCLQRCHGDPAAAPASMVARYGTRGGFHLDVDEVALDTVAIPMASIRSAVQHRAMIDLGVVMGSILLLCAALFLAFQRVVSGRLQYITNRFQQALTEDNEVVPLLEVESNDEIGVMAEGFNALAGRLRTFHESLEEKVAERTTALREQITQRERAEEELRRRHHLNAILLDAFPCGALLVNGDFEVVAANRTARELEVMPGTVCPRATAAQELRHPFCRPQRATPLDRPHSREAQLRGQVWDVHWIPVQDDLYLYYAFDVTERRRMEDNLRQAQKLEAVGTLAGGVAHDFNNILAAILGFTELSLLDTPAESPAHGSMQRVFTAATRAREVVRQILVFSRQEEGESGAVDLREVVDEELNLLRASLPSTVEIRVEDGGGSCLVLADPTEIHQVLLNLCTNAGHAMRQCGGVLGVTLEPVEVPTGASAPAPGVEPGRWVRLQVRDSGCGMDAETQERIFEPYFTTKEAGAGSGLGLAMVHGIVSGCGGAVAVESEPGVGSCFTVWLPHVDAVEAPTALADGPIPQGTERIWLIDDEEEVLCAEADLLRRLGYQVQTFIRCADALAQLKQDPGGCDLVITDQTLPAMTGSEFIPRALGVRSDLPIILCTGFSERVDESAARELGAREFLFKPLQRAELSRAVRGVLEAGPVP